ncbi:MAG: histidinol-phosphate transaminase [Clostridia bacterium]|nr:histidinol-phosphate transaminase [Clostridia bacterium]
MSNFLKKRYKQLEAYVPGEQPKGMKYIKLNTNESPYPPSEATVQAVSSEAALKLNLYPDPSCIDLKKVIADRYCLSHENVFVSNGSDDILNFAFMAFGEKAVFPDITYGFYEVFCQLHGIEYEKIPLDENLNIVKNDYMKDNAMIAIANPNAPTGLALKKSDIEEILRANPNHVVLIDEAYIDFGGESAVDLIGKYPNLLVVQTFSKSRSLAGARIGFAFANEELIKDLEKIKYSTNPYSINKMSLNAGIAAVQSDLYYRACCGEIIKTREFCIDKLRKLGFFVTDSKANFLFVKSDAISGEMLYEKLRKKGILVRHFNGERIKEYNRITIGTPEEMNAFLTAVKEILN